MESPPPTVHIPVLAAEVIEGLNLKLGQKVVDGTLGGAGHTKMILEKIGPEGLVIACDRDPTAIERAEKVLKGQPVLLVHTNFSDIPEVLSQIKIPLVDGILLDLGFSSDQLLDETRGFSFQTGGILDLRFDTSVGTPAWRLLERLSERHLADLIFNYGEDRCSRKIARKIVATRRKKIIKTAEDLASLVASVVPRSPKERIHPATRTFQALRIAVNEELLSLERALARVADSLNIGGRIAIISFHSLEDRLVKNAFRDHKKLEIITKKVIVPSETELHRNPRSRSAKLRIAEKIA
ncbi:MAG: 16S rRNA (cytosine(1402)-N(4))-methyltransferase RsmH [Pirellulaceae bacterium]|nr:16S rRNA (cytosine(1402)-N(4))-methyltransferase RsmH [Pirellulaceae bacterium]